MDIELFNEFVVLSKTLNYSKAAQQLYISQSVLSRHIQNLESQLGVTLLSRNKHSVELTAIGEVFAKDAEKIRDSYQMTMKHIEMAKEGNIGHLKLHSSTTLSSFFMYDFLLDFSKKYPYIQVRTSLMYPSDQDIQKVISGEADVAILLNWEDEDLHGLSKTVFFKDHLYLLVAADGPLAQKESISIQELSGMPMIYFSTDENKLAYTYFYELFARHQATYNPSILAENPESLYFKILSGEGVSIISRKILNQLPTGVKYVRISDEDAYRDIIAVWRPDSTNPSLPVFIEEFSIFSQNYKTQHPLDIQQH